MTKTVKNPYTFMIYTGPEFRSFSGSWLMIPDNAEESKRYRTSVECSSWVSCWNALT